MAGTGVRLELDTAELGRLYVDAGWTLAAIAKQSGCGATTVRRRLSELGIPCRRRGPLPGPLNRRPEMEWTAELAWVVGLVATDGNLSRNGRGLTVVSKDIDLLETLARCVGTGTRITPHRGGYSQACHRLQWSDRGLHEWLARVGLMPAKSLCLGALDVPDQWFPDFLRGCIDGDGSITVYTDRSHASKNERYVYERLWVSLVSASPAFLEWIGDSVARLRGIRGSTTVQRRATGASIWRLRYGKGASIDLIRWMYYAPDLPGLARKRARAHRFLDVLGHVPTRGTGRPRVGWLYNEAPR